MVTKLLYDFRSREFIGNFITKTVNQWIKEIDEELEKILQEGKTHEAADILKYFLALLWTIFPYIIKL